MSMVVTGFMELIDSNNDMMISDKKKKDILWKAGRIAQDAVTAETYKRTGRLKRSWRLRYQRLDGNQAIRLYSTVSHDIYNEFGSSTNKEHIGFFSNTIDAHTEEVIGIMIKGVFEK